MKREDFKKHTTRQVIFRLDFLPLEKEALERIRVKLMSNFAGGLGYQYGESFAKNYELEAPKFDSGNIEDSRLVLEGKLASSAKTYEYVYKIDNIKAKRIVLSRGFFGVEINQDVEYLTFEQYFEDILSIIKAIKDEAKNTFIPIRCGLRKLNDIKLLPEANLCDYFNEILATNPFGKKTFVERYSQRYAFKIAETLNANYVFAVLPGVFNGAKVKRVSFDIDVFTEERALLSDIIDNGDCLNKLNEEIFCLFNLTLKSEFAETFRNDEGQKDPLVVDGVLNNTTKKKEE